MNILVIGASVVWSELVQQLLDDNHSVTGTSRENNPLFDNDNYTHLAVDLTAEKEEIAKQIAGNFDAVYFTAGSGGKDVLGVDFAWRGQNHASGANQRHSRYIMLSTVFH